MQAKEFIADSKPLQQGEKCNVIKADGNLNQDIYYCIYSGREMVSLLYCILCSHVLSISRVHKLHGRGLTWPFEKPAFLFWTGFP